MKTERSPQVAALMVRNLESTVDELTRNLTAHPCRSREKQIEAVKKEIDELRAGGSE